ncbi:hypothetical protein [Trichocoleus sp. FACHB-262]|uniref:hypothetical protein n=1 Tax=Trichocoleus sp. FACHB-262 TaxID=2692869 RepID=UPI0016821F25|nr:hypothetical protein [Trichocoleus sp. FACHB-262]MBD2122527.1 hypothetical protein [Trichocoleus sp. FACHB-262]
MTKTQQIGRAILIAIGVLTLAPELYILTLRLNSGGIPIEDVVRLALTAALSYCVWLGMRWAKWLAVFLLTMGGLILIALGAISPPLVSGMGILYIALAISLGFIPAVKEFLAYQRKPRVTNQAE